MAAWFLLAGVLLPDAFKTDSNDPTTTVLVIGVIAYISGFSERFIPDLIVRSSKSSAAEGPPPRAAAGGPTT
jgi:hypothetical protein